VSDEPVVVVAFGGNALVRSGQAGTADEQLENIRAPMRKVAALARDHRVVITHGNGPQVGNLLLQQESTAEVPRMPVDVIGAMTQGELGYMIESVLERTLRDEGLDRNFLTVITMVQVDEDDPLLRNPIKPIGPFYGEDAARTKPYPMVRTDKGYRRVIASPMPIGIVPHREIKQLVGMDWIVICAGGGGIPVVKEGTGWRGVEAVIDKDLASSLLAREIGADLFVIATDVAGVGIDWGRARQHILGTITQAELREHAEAGQFPPGSMGPKVDAALNFVAATGNRAIICHLDEIEAALAGEAGTNVVPDQAADAD
jgi:carbamate kinase